MAEGVWRKSFGSLRPADDDAQELLDRVPNGGLVRMADKGTRNMRQHRLWWALMTLAFNNQDQYAVIKAMVDAVKIGVGHCEIFIAPHAMTLTTADGEVFDLPAGTVGFRPNSMAVDKMKQADFDAFFQATVGFLIQRMLPGWKNEDLTAEVYAMVGDDRERV